MAASTAGIIVSLTAGLVAGGALTGLAFWVWIRQQDQRSRAVGHAQCEARLRAQEHAHSEQIRQLRQAHRAALHDLATEQEVDHDALRRECWFDILRKVPWDPGAPEVEVEAKFVFQFLQFLGYEEEDMALRTAIPVQEGSRQTTLEVDWLVRDVLDQALLVIEVKAPDQPLNETVREQARSYAFRLGAPAYAITNGLELRIYRLGVVKDALVVSCRTAELAQHWEAVEELANKANLTALRWELGDGANERNHDTASESE